MRTRFEFKLLQIASRIKTAKILLKRSEGRLRSLKKRPVGFDATPEEMFRLYLYAGNRTTWVTFGTSFLTKSHAVVHVNSRRTRHSVVLEHASEEDFQTLSLSVARSTIILLPGLNTLTLNCFWERRKTPDIFSVSFDYLIGTASPYREITEP